MSSRLLHFLIQLCASTLIGFWALAALAQSDASASITALDATPGVLTIHKEVQEVNLVLTVTDHRGHLVRDLLPSDFVILDDDRPPVRITYFDRQTTLPLRIALVIDTSDSVAACFDAEKKFAAAFLKHVLHVPDDLALVIGFNQEVRVAQPPTTDVGLLSHALHGLRAGGGTAIYDAVSAASQELEKTGETQPSRRAIILITDGEDNHSHIAMQQAAELALRDEVIIYVINTSTATSPSDKDDLAMTQLSETTGGNSMHADTDDRIASAFAKIKNQLRTQYVIGYKPSNTTPNGSFHRLTVLGPNNLRVHHRNGYFAK